MKKEEEYNQKKILKEINEQERMIRGVKDKRAMILISIACILVLFVSYVAINEAFYYKEKYNQINQSIIGCAELNKIVLDGLEACTDYCNITNEEYKMILFDYLYENERGYEK